MKKFTLSVCAFALFSFTLLSSLEIQAQPATRDENISRDPMVMVPGYVPPSGDASTATVVTIGDYDNFKLGVDFAECSIANNPRNPLQYYATWNSTGSAGGKGYYTNNGYDWTAGNPNWTGMMGDVVVSYDSLGNLAYSNMYGNVTGAKVAISTNNGQTWNSPVNAILGSDKNWMAADQTAGPYANRLISTMTGGAGGNVSRSTDNGVSWQNITNLSTQSLPGMSECIGPQGNIQGGAQYVVTNGGSSSFASVYTFYRSTDGGQTFQLKGDEQFANYCGSNVGGRNSVQNMRVRPYPFIAADNSYGPHRGRVYLVYASNNPSGNGHKPDIFCRYSDDGTATWSLATVVNDDINSVNNHNWFPAIWCEKETGRLYVSWMDTRDCPTSDSSMMYASYSDDGVTFAANQRISNKKAKINCTSCGGGGTPAYLGDYNGVAANTLGSMIAWTDFRDGNFASYVAYFPDFGSKISPAIDTLAPVATFNFQVPSVKLFTDTVIISVAISSPGLFTISYPQGNKLWSFPGQIPVEISGNGIVPVGDYVVTITATGSNGTPVHKRTATLRALTAIAPLANFSASTTTVCAGSSVNFTDLSSGPPSSWAWTFAGGTPESSSVANPTNIVYSTPGTYDVSLTVTNLQGTNSKTITGYITVVSAPAAPAALSLGSCEGSPVPDLTAEGDNIKWYSNVGLTILVHQGNTFATGHTTHGNFTYYVTQNPEGCESAGTPVTLTINQLPVATFDPLSAVCANAPAFDLVGGAPAGGLYSGTGVTASGLVFDPQLAGQGIFDLSYIYSDAFGCSDTAYQTITVNALPDVTLDAVNPVCTGAPAFELTGGFPVGGTYSGNGVTGTTFDPAVAGTGSAIITYSVSDGITGCQNSASTIMVVNPLPAVNLGLDQDICANLSINLDATVANGQSYLWSPGGETTASIHVDTLGIGLHTKQFSVAVTDINGCIAEDQISITFHDCTGIDENQGSITFNIYPNPTSGIITLNADGISNTTISIQVYTASDKLVYNEPQMKVVGSLNKTLNLQHLPDGIYLLKIQDTENRWTKRFIIHK
jgi:PKD repeat protein